MPHLRLVPDHDIVSDGKTVWVNSAQGCLGRFSPNGVDVHKTAQGQIESGTACLDCSEVPDWGEFVRSMKEHHGIEIPKTYRPLWTFDPVRWARGFFRRHGATALRRAVRKIDEGKVPNAEQLGEFSQAGKDLLR
tara:strand:+ start:221 stop:625 length:405 start_codon:yes stop_codon:yes gene_type:complete